MRKAAFCLFVLALLVPSLAFAYASPGKPAGYVNDFAGILTAQQRSALESRIAEYARPAGAQIAVATVKSLEGETVESYAEKLFREWGIGDRVKDNGLLLLVAPNEREVRIEVGYGLEPSVTDAASSVIVRNAIMPAFKEGDYYGGIDQALTALMGLIDRDPETVKAVQYQADAAARDRSLSKLFPLAFFALAVVLNLLGVMARSRSWWLGGVLGLVLGFIFAGLVGALVCLAIGLAVDFFLSRFGSNWFKGPRGPWTIGGGGWGSDSSGGSSGSSSDGFGGFGGGSSGGGGASGRW
ncbi:MAG TPA: TPM domain-containing protein [Candidatus Paceibacterota bacterium]|nr:TPM domain-containing protein [Candidatus Paceibacterota bacterium]